LGVAFNDGTPDSNRNATLPECVDESLRSRWGETYRMPTCRKRNNGPILRDHGIDETEVPRDSPEVIENAAGDNGNHNTPFTDVCDRTTHLWIKHAVASDGAIIIERQNCKPHETISSWTATASHGSPADFLKTKLRYVQSNIASFNHGSR
jgi:hypothetical protein